MKKFFNTEEKALKHLVYRRSCAYERIEKRRDKILGDASFIYKNEKGKWLVFLQILTEGCVRDMEKLKEETERFNQFCLLPLSEQEKIIKKEKRLGKLEKKYKTLDIEDYTINKDI